VSLAKSTPRLFVEGDLSPDARLEATPEQSHYLKHVMRLGGQDTVALFNGRDGEWLARLEPEARHRLFLRSETRLRPQAAEPGPWLAFAPIKKAAGDFLVEKATELGAERLIPVITKHTVTSRVNLDRLAANAREAAEQCGRLTVPEVLEPRPLDHLVRDWPAHRRLLVGDERGTGRPLAQVLAEPPLAGAPLGLLIGPEGGFAAAELDGLGQLPFTVLVSLGPRVLRAETAALAGLACIQALGGG
jgi:16S rRNA (uracil1498-N3)-methyltransferase